MKYFSYLSIRTKLMILVFVAVLPALGVILLSGINHREATIVATQRDILHLAISLASQQEQLAASTRQMLRMLAQRPEVKEIDAAACKKIFSDIQKQNPIYSIINAVTPDGQMFAASSPFTTGSVNLSDRKHIKDAIRTRDFSVGEYIVGRVVSAPTILYSYPVLDEKEKLIAVVSAGIKLDEYKRFITLLNLPEESVASLADHKNLTLYRFPERKDIPPGTSIPFQNVRGIPIDSKEGLYEAIGRDNVSRIFAYKRLWLRDNEQPYMVVYVGIAKSAALHRANLELAHNLAFLGIACLFAMLLAWIAGNSTIVKPLKKLVRATKKFGKGEIHVRTDIPHGEDELGRLAKSFDDMAATLESNDIRRREAEEALRKSELLWRLSIDNMLEAYALHEAIFDENGRMIDYRFLEINSAAAKISNISRIEIVGRTALELYPHIVERGLLDRYADVMATGVPAVIDDFYYDGDNLDKAFDISCFRIDDRHFVCVFRDITERKLAEEQMHALMERLHVATRSARMGIWDWDIRKNSLIWDDQMYLLYGVRREDFSGAYDAWLGGLHPDDRAESDEISRQALQGIKEYDTEFRVVLPSGGIRILKATADVIRDRDGTPLRMIGVNYDITELRRLEEDRVEMERKLLHAQKLESLGVLAGGIAHDFNNLLMAMLGNLELAMEEISPLSPSRRYLENTRQAARRAADLTRQMLAYSGKGRFVIENTNLSELVQENIHIFRSSIPATIILNLHLNNLTPLIMADNGQIQQVVMNLIMNASEAIGDKGGSINLSTGVQTCDEACLKRSRLHEKPVPGDFVYLEVTDTGCGMNEETQQKIFDPFFTTKFTGRGLGMSALQGIILGHKGAIFVDSAIGKGTTIRVIFPVSDRVQGQTRPVISPQTERSVPDTPLRSGLVLIADDDEAMRRLASDMVARMGYQTRTAADGEEAVEVFRQHAENIVCVILDLTMPKMDGFVTFQAMKQLRSGIKVILSSGYNEQVITERFTGLGLAGFIQKPYRLQQLKDEIDRVMKGN